jgi:predicted nucleic acid-binding protein
MVYLADTNVLLRLTKRDDPKYFLVRSAVSTLEGQGVQVHDARLAAAMYAHGISHILTFNGNDFRRYPGISAIHADSVGK